MTWKARAMAVQNGALAVARKWWRPIICLGLGASLFTNGVLMPILEGKGADLAGLAALVASVTPFAWFRTQEKVKGVSKDTP